MPSCPHCNGIYFGNPDQCPECKFDFKLQRVVSLSEMQKLQSERESERQNRIEHIQQERNRQEEERIRYEKQLLQHKEELQRKKSQLRQNALLQNPHYEYATEYLSDSRTGLLAKEDLDAVLIRYATDGWRLHSVITNELGKNVDPAFVGSRNATVEVTILIFERCIKLAGE